MYANTTLQSGGLRWLAGVLTNLADFLDRMDTAPGGRASLTASEECDEVRARILSRYY
ncbi:MAG TPA: hypothetical protein VLH12_11445 [Usitatibacter sp.]|nr:hypothetical protein [Usitatibacter sp.]